MKPQPNTLFLLPKNVSAETQPYDYAKGRVSLFSYGKCVPSDFTCELGMREQGEQPLSGANRQ